MKLMVLVAVCFICLLPEAAGMLFVMNTMFCFVSFKYR